MGRKRKSPEKPKKGLGRRARKQQPPETPHYLKEVKGSYGIPGKGTMRLGTIKCKPHANITEFPFSLSLFYEYSCFFWCQESVLIRSGYVPENIGSV